MPSHADLVRVATDLDEDLNEQVCLTIARTDITDLVRKRSGEANTRIKPQMAAMLERALLEQGVRCFPLLTTTTTGDMIRLFRPGSMIAGLVDTLAHPSQQGDRDLRRKVKKLSK